MLMKRIAIVDNKKLKIFEEKKIIQSKCPVNMVGKDCMYFEGEKLLINEDLCTGCGICVKFDNYNSIKIINLIDEKNKKVIHQYGTNGFRIFDLPLLNENSTIGIVGKNGIGKTTIVNILSNNTKANFGEFLEEIPNEIYFKNLIDKYKGSALQNYFTKLRDEKIRVAFKLQQIINIPKIFSGSVLNLLKKVQKDEKVIVDFSKKFNIEKILDRDIKVLSGGELQRVALCSTLLKKDICNLFIFDEITNYLDIYQRLNTSKIIKEELSQKTNIVIEHDLIILDYLCDYIHLMYGETNAFGMLTGIKSSKQAINEYLEGFSKQENVRFRDKKVSFDKTSINSQDFKDKLVEWEEDEISFDNFSLKINKGLINKGEIVGIIGENALGKTCFIKYLEKKLDIKVSFKPQLIEQTEDLVLSILSQYPNFKDNFYDVYVLKPLDIEKLYEKKLEDLSGGELQKFAIVKCLLEDSDIYLFDEPTAFLDIEERLNLSKILKNFFDIKKKSAIIIDHDLVFIDYLSNKLMAFLGEPSIKGVTNSPVSLRDGMNTFLKTLNITFRRDENNKRPRVNKFNSVNDKNQKQLGEYYYV